MESPKPRTVVFPVEDMAILTDGPPQPVLPAGDVDRPFTETPDNIAMDGLALQAAGPSSRRVDVR
jgi:hypothetical protein